MTYCGERGRVRLRDFKMAVTCDVSSLASSRAPPAISPSRLALSLTAAIALRQTRYIADVALQIRHSRFRVPKLQRNICNVARLTQSKDRKSTRLNSSHLG